MSVNDQILSSMGVTFDADAQAFITAAGISDATQQVAINTLVVGLKANSLWTTKMDAIWPLVGGTASTHKWNLVNPVDTDAAHRLTFTGGLTHSSTGILPNGTSGFADMKYPLSVYATNNNTHFSFYSRTDIADPEANNDDMGVNDGVAIGYQLLCRQGALGGQQVLADVYAGTGRLNNTVTTSLGLFTVSCTGSGGAGAAAYQAGTSLITNAPSQNVTTCIYSPYIFARNASGTADLFGIRQCAFASIGKGLTAGEVSTLNGLVQAYQTTLSRQV